MIVEQLWEKFPDLKDIRVREVVVDKVARRISCSVSLPDSNNISPATKREIVDFVKSTVPANFHCSVTFFNDKFTELSFKKFFVDTLKAKYPMFSFLNKEKISVKIQDKHVDVQLLVGPVMKGNMETANFVEDFCNYCKSYTSYSVFVQVEEDANYVPTLNLDDQQKLVKLSIKKELLKPARYFEVENVQKHVGKIIGTRAMYIGDVRGASQSAVLCGTVSNKTLKASKNNSSLQICNFTLTDESGNIPCVMFVRFEMTDVTKILKSSDSTQKQAEELSEKNKAINDKRMKKMMDIFDTMQVIVRGKIGYNDFSQRLEMVVFDLCKCTIKPMSQQPKAVAKVPSRYTLVHPQRFEEHHQLSFVAEMVTSNLQQDYVVVNAQLTGNNLAKDKLFGICCVKISKGRIAEKFFTVVNPEIHLDDNQLASIGCGVDKLQIYPTITEIIPDLFKFLHGYDVVGINLVNTLNMLNYYAIPYGYSFNNKIVNEQDFLLQLLENSTISKRPNLGKVEEIAKVCKVVYEGNVECDRHATIVARSIVYLSERAL